MFFYYKGEAPALPIVYNIMDSTVSIYDSGNSGTGTIFKKTNRNTYILTCAHVISSRNPPVKPIFNYFNYFDHFKPKIAMIEPNSPFLDSIQKPIIIRKSKWIDGIQKSYTKTADIFVIDRMNDICILKINGDFPGQEIKIYKQTIPVGEEVYHVGNLLGYLEYSVLSGIISHNSRGIFGEKIQVDIKATFGCSGGGIFTKDKGKYVGMVSEKSKTSDATITISIKKILRWMEVYGIDKNF